MWVAPAKAADVSGLSDRTLARLHGTGRVRARVTSGGHRRYLLTAVDGVLAVAVARRWSDEAAEGEAA